jgi:glycosyltransferase involved in cell wall biosynthesis
MISNQLRTTWITWQRHRRTVELADALGSHLLVVSGSGLYRLINTVRTLRENRDTVIIVQNPSRVLAAVASLCKVIWGFPLVIDRHTNFRIGKPLGFNPKTWFVVFCSELSIRLADLTIVTNEFLRAHVEEKKGKGFVLPDRVPSLSTLPSIYLQKNLDHREKCVLFICTFANDEPYKEVIQAAENLPDSVKVFITGSYRDALDKNELARIPKNVTLTGFLPEVDYESLVTHADVVIDFTSLEWCLVCGGYEALAAGRPFVTSNTSALREFFEGSAVHCAHDPKRIAEAILFAIENSQQLAKMSENLRQKKTNEWKELFGKLQEELQSLHNPKFS